MHECKRLCEKNEKISFIDNLIQYSRNIICIYNIYIYIYIYIYIFINTRNAIFISKNPNSYDCTSFYYSYESIVYISFVLDLFVAFDYHSGSVFDNRIYVVED